MGYIIAMAKEAITRAPLGALKLKDAALYLGDISPTTVRRLIKRGLLRPNRALRHLLIPVAELDRFIGSGGKY
jgi:hypothetical protein